VSVKTILSLLGAGVLGVVFYIGRCAWFPLAACWRCRGEGKFRSWGGKGKTWHLCRRCKGTGSRVRPGRILWDKMRTNRRNARKAG
jgi:hypothetical protein